MKRLAISILLVGCARPAAPAGETDEPCSGGSPDRDWVRGSTAEETAGITRYPSLVRMSVRGSTPYAKHHRGWGYSVSGVVGLRNGDACTLERRVVWRRGESCEVEHTRIHASDAECSDFLACVRASTRSGGDGGLGRCDSVLQADGETFTVERSSGLEYRGCEWTRPPACVLEESSRAR
jgi:hypothetical protein